MKSLASLDLKSTQQQQIKLDGLKQPNNIFGTIIDAVLLSSNFQNSLKYNLLNGQTKIFVEIDKIYKIAVLIYMIKMVTGKVVEGWQHRGTHVKQKGKTSKIPHNK
ncbi:hypothetical protein ACJX0J_033688 [Zea mays]